MSTATKDLAEERRRMTTGELYHAFIPEFVQDRQRASQACDRFNRAIEPSRRDTVRFWRDTSIVNDDTPLPPSLPEPEDDDALFEDDPWVQPPVRVDYGYNVKLGKNVYLNFNTTILDTCTVEIGARTLVGPNCSFFSATHPLDPFIRNGTAGPELGKPIKIGEDCWLGGNVIILPGVTIGRGCTIGAGSVVTKDVPDFHVAAGNPAKIIKAIVTRMDPSQAGADTQDQHEGAEVPMAKQ